jgi:hypothetical protein
MFEWLEFFSVSFSEEEYTVHPLFRSSGWTQNGPGYRDLDLTENPKMDRLFPPDLAGAIELIRYIATRQGYRLFVRERQPCNRSTPGQGPGTSLNYVLWLYVQRIEEHVQLHLVG